MNKRAILILSLLSIVAFIAAMVASIGAAATCTPDATTSAVACGSAAAAGAGIGFILWLAAVVLGIIGWILGLIKTAQIGRWGWFVFILLFSPFTSLIYGIAGPEDRAAV